MGLADVGLGVEHVLVGRRDVHVAAHDRRRLAPGRHHLAQRREPRELVLIVLGAGGAPVRHVHRDHADPVARRRHGTRLGVREARRALDPGDDVVEPDPGQDRDPVPRRLAVGGGDVAAVGELVAEQLGERVVGELGLLQADHVGLALVEPGQQPRQPLLERVDVPGRDPHRRYGSGVYARTPVTSTASSLDRTTPPARSATRRFSASSSTR